MLARLFALLFFTTVVIEVESAPLVRTKPKAMQVGEIDGEGRATVMDSLSDTLTEVEDVGGASAEGLLAAIRASVQEGMKHMRDELTAKLDSLEAKVDGIMTQVDVGDRILPWTQQKSLETIPTCQELEELASSHIQALEDMMVSMPPWLQGLAQNLALRCSPGFKDMNMVVPSCTDTSATLEVNLPAQHCEGLWENCDSDGNNCEKIFPWNATMSSFKYSIKVDMEAKKIYQDDFSETEPIEITCYTSNPTITEMCNVKRERGALIMRVKDSILNKVSGLIDR